MRWSAAAVVVAAALAACTGTTDTGPSPSPSSPTASSGGTLRWALPGDPTSLDPARIVTAADEVVVDALFDSLTRLDAEGRVRPAVARSWQVSDAATTFRFLLDPAARWHDGSRVTAADVVRGLSRVSDGSVARPSLHAELLEPVVGFRDAREGRPLRGVVAVDDTTVEIRTRHAVPDLPMALAHPALAPAPPPPENGQDSGDLPTGNGPFALAEPWVHNQFLRLLPVEGHTRQPRVDELLFRVYGGDPSGEVRWADLVAGQVQVSDVPVARLSEVDGLIGPGALRDRLTDVTSLLLVSSTQPVVEDPRARRALSLLLDRDEIAGRTNGARTSADALVPPPLLGARESPCATCRWDEQAGMALVTEVLAGTGPQATAGSTSTPDPNAVPDLGDGDPGQSPSASAGTASSAPGPAAAAGPGADGRPRSDATPPLVVLTADDPVSVAIAQQAREALRRFEVSVRLAVVPPMDVAVRIADDQPAVVVLPWTSLSPTAESFLTELLGDLSVARTVTGWEPSALDKLLRTIRDEADPSERRRLVHELEDLVLRSATVIPVHFRRGDLAVAPGVEGLVVGIDGSVDLTAVTVSTAG